MLKSTTMDISCPSFVLDKTSDYGSQDTFFSEQPIGGITMVQLSMTGSVICNYIS